MTAVEDDTPLDRIAEAMGAVADAIHHLAENVWEHRKTAEENADKLATAITRIAYGGSEPTGLEALTMTINGKGDPGGFPLTTAIGDGFHDIAEAIRESRESRPSP
jgi:hypothetical protein